jgi:hypothetical protein
MGIKEYQLICLSFNFIVLINRMNLFSEGLKLAEYECILDYVKGQEKHPIDQELTITLRDPDTFSTIKAKAIIRSSFEQYPNADKLYYFSGTLGREKEPVPVVVLEVIPDEVEEVKALPKQKLSLGQRKGRMLADMIRERQDKDK